MKKWIPILLCCALLLGCAANETPESTTEPTPTDSGVISAPVPEEIPYVSRFDSETLITLSDDGITVTGNQEAVYTSNDIIYYEEKDAYESGNAYGAGDDGDKHSPAEAAAHTVVNITQSGAYRVTGTLSAGQIRIDLGEEAPDDENAVVELILDNASITCTVAPAILFRNVYECYGNWSTETAKADVDTSAAGANLVLEGENTVHGSYVAKIYKDNDKQKKLWKQDGAVYSYMSMNVYGPGTMNLYAENEGLDTELHLTINGGNINIYSTDDGINTNEDGVSVTTVNGGCLHIIAGLGAEGDGIDSNGYLVINGGVVVSAAHPASDAGLDSDMGSYVNGGIVVALGSTMDWAESDSDQVTMNLQFARRQTGDASIVVTDTDGNVVFAYDPGEDEILGENGRQYQGAVISSPNFQVGQNYQLYLGASVSGSEEGGVYDVSTVTGITGGTQMMYTSTDGFGQRPGGMEPPEGFDPSTMEKPEGEPPEGFDPGSMEKPEGEPPEGFDPGSMEKPEGEPPEGFDPGSMEKPEGEPPEDFDPGSMEMPEGEPPEGFDPGSMEMPEGEPPEMPSGTQGEGSNPSASGENATNFYMNDKVNAFSGITAAE